MNFYLRKCTFKKFCTNVNKNDISFLSVCRLFSEVESNSKLSWKKQKMTEYLKKFVDQINKDKNKKEESFKRIGEIIKISIPYLNMIQNKLHFRDKDEPFEINLRYQYTFDFMIKNYIRNAFGIEMNKIQEEYIKRGDLPKYLFHLFSERGIENKTDSELKIEEVLEYKENIVRSIGNKSIQDKMELFSDLINKCTDLIEILFISRIFLNKLKIGLGEKNLINIILDLEKDFTNKQDFKQLISYLEKEIFKYQIYYPMKIKSQNSIDLKDENNLDFETTLKPGTFVDLQLGRPGMDLDKLISTMEKSTFKCLAEMKYDGERSQMHFNGSEILMASRSSQDQTILYQNLRNQLQNEILKWNINHPMQKLKNFIIDGEIVSYSHKTKAFCHFQELRKKENVSEEKDNIEYFYIAFDILYINDVNVHVLNLEERKKLLKDFFYQKFKTLLIENGKIINLQNLESAKKELIKYFEYSKKLNCEGLVCKELGKRSNYHFGKRRWYKLKTLNDSISDTLDLIPIAGLIGKGSQKSQMNSFLMAAYDSVNDTYIGVCKLGTGFDQKDLRDIQDRFTPYMISIIPENYIIPRLLRPTFFFKPKEVWEVGFDSFSESLNYTIGNGLINEDKGLSLRFPRFIRFRPDKLIKDASTPSDIVELYLDQSKQNGNNLIIL